MELKRDAYACNPLLRDYFLSLPGAVQAKLLHSGVYLESLGELMTVAENMKKDLNE